MPKKYKLLIFLIGLFIIICFIFLKVFNNNSFKLEEKYYDNYNAENPFTEIDSQKLNELLKEKESFGIFIYQPLCVTSNNFEEVLLEFMNKYKINFYKIAFSDLANTSLEKEIKYYPSFVIFEKGKVTDYLEADKDTDIEYYENSEGFEKWFTKYVKLENKISNDNLINSTNSSIDDIQDTKIELDNVIREDNKVNIYFFWGDGCPHCEEEFKFFKSIESEYSKYYNLYDFETWFNEDNVKILEVFSKAKGDKVKGVPYTIIGEQSFSGFNDSSKEKFLKAIKDQYQNSYDIYFDKIKE